jgi:hypothetical protein
MQDTIVGAFITLFVRFSAEWDGATFLTSDFIEWTQGNLYLRDIAASVAFSENAAIGRLLSEHRTRLGIRLSRRDVRIRDVEDVPTKSARWEFVHRVALLRRNILTGQLAV